MTITEKIRIAGTAEAIAEALMKCGKVKDMAEAFRAVTGEDFYGKIVGVKKDERKIESAMPLLRIESEAADEKFKALSVSEKFNELIAVNANVASRYVYMCSRDEVETIAQMLGIKTGNVFTLVVKALEVREQRVRIERLIELGADEKRVRAELQFKGDVLALLAHELGIKVIERADEKEVVNKLIAHYFEKTESVSQPEAMYMDDSFSDASGDNSCPEQDIPEPYISEESPDSMRANQRGEKFLQCRSISAVKREITAMLNKYAEISGTIQVIKEGVTNIRKCIKICKKQGLPIGAFEKVIKEAREKYREIRREGFKLRLKLLRVMSASEIRLACKAFMARCEKERRRHNE